MPCPDHEIWLPVLLAHENAYTNLRYSSQSIWMQHMPTGHNFHFLQELRCLDGGITVCKIYLPLSRLRLKLTLSQYLNI